MWDLIVSVPDRCLSFYFAYDKTVCSPPHVTQHALLSEVTFYIFTQHIKVASWIKGGGGGGGKQGQPSEKWFITLKVPLRFFKKKTLHYL